MGLMTPDFGELLTEYREKTGLTKTALAKKIHKSPGYIMNLESGRKNPPPFDLCEKIINILELNEDEKERFLFAAISGRTSKEDKKFYEAMNKSRIDEIVKTTKGNEAIWGEFSKRINKELYDKLLEMGLSPIPKDIEEALQDPIAVKALKVTFKNKQDAKNTIEAILECISDMSPKKRQALIALCR